MPCQCIEYTPAPGVESVHRRLRSLTPIVRNVCCAVRMTWRIRESIAHEPVKVSPSQLLGSAMACTWSWYAGVSHVILPCAVASMISAASCWPLPLTVPVEAFWQPPPLPPVRPDTTCCAAVQKRV